MDRIGCLQQATTGSCVRMHKIAGRVSGAIVHHRNTFPSKPQGAVSQFSLHGHIRKGGPHGAEAVLLQEPLLKTALIQSI